MFFLETVLNHIYLFSSVGQNAIYLMLIASLLKTLHYPSCCLRVPAFNDFFRDSYCALLVMTKNASVIQRMQNSVKDDSFSYHLTVTIWKE